MSAVMRFNDALEVVERLTLDEQTELVEVMRRRLADRERNRLLEELRESREEYARGEFKTATADELMKEIES